VVAHRVDYDHVALAAEGCQGKDGHTEGERHEELVQLTAYFAVGPGVEGIDGGAEGHADKDKDEVPHGQADQ